MFKYNVVFLVGLQPRRVRFDLPPADGEGVGDVSRTSKQTATPGDARLQVGEATHAVAISHRSELARGSSRLTDVDSPQSSRRFDNTSTRQSVSYHFGCG